MSDIQPRGQDERVENARALQLSTPGLSGNYARLSLKHLLVVLVAYTLLYLLFFAPVLFSDRLLAPGDGIIYFLPNFAAPRVLWDTRIWGGFPAVGDSQLMLWYPPALFCSVFGASGYQPFVVAAYVLASSFAYCYIFTLTHSRLAAAVTGCVYGLSAFMVTHAGHASIIHTAAWLPLVIWAFKMLQCERNGRVWLVVAALAISFSALAGHPQIFVYLLVTAAAFVLFTGWHAPLGRWRYFGRCAGVTAVGAGIAAVQLLPTSELANLSWRAALGFPEFVAYELPLRQLPGLVFPYLYGGSPSALYGVPYFGAWPSDRGGELSGYVGLMPLVLAAIGFIAHRRNGHPRFWLGIVVLAFLLTLGESTPLAHLVYLLPLLNKFRAPARHFIELTFAISVLAGLGISVLQRRATSSRLVGRALAVACLGLLSCLISLFIFAGKINELAFQRLGHAVQLKPWVNHALAMPLLVFCAVSAALLYWARQPSSQVRSALLITTLLFDLASFGWFNEWHYGAPYKAYLHAPAAARSYRDELNSTHQRLLPVRGGTGRVNELPPNLSKLWDITSASGYGPFILTRLSRLLTMPPHGSVDESWRNPDNQSLDLMSVRYIILPPDEIELPATTDEHGTRWAASDFAVDLGFGCSSTNPLSYQIDLPKQRPATSVALVGALACSVQIPDGQEVLRVTLTDDAGESANYTLRAGSDFSEWAYDCPDVRPTLQHARAQVFRSYPVQRGAFNCEGHYYITRNRIDNGHTKLKEAFTIRRIELRWIGPAGTFALKKITLLNDDTGTSMPVSPVAGTLADTTRWRQVGEINLQNSGYGPEVEAQDAGAGVLFENLRALPRAWLVSEVMSLSSEDVFNAIRSSRLPDGRALDPGRLALVEGPVDFKAQPADPNANAQVISLGAEEMEVRTSSNAPAFLVTSDVLYPGWRATVDGVPAFVYQTDYALRGVPVPAGTHVVRFEFSSRSLYYGAGVSAFSLLLLVGWMLWPLRGRMKLGT
jgi:hypothetical protein